MERSVDSRRSIGRAALAAACLLGTGATAQAAVSVAPATVTVTRGQTSGPITVTLVFPAPAPPGTGAVQVSFPSALAGRASTVPSTVTYTWPNTAATSATATFRIATSSSAPPGTYAIAITDLTRSSGTATLNLVITAPPAPPPPPLDFAFRAEPADVELERSGAPVRLSIVTERRTLTGGNITYSLVALPAGLIAGPAAVSQGPGFGPVELTLGAGPTAVAGQFTATVRGVHRPGNVVREQRLTIRVRLERPIVDAVEPAVLAAGTPNRPVRIDGRHFQIGAVLEAPAYLRFTRVRVIGPGRIEALVSVRADAPPGPAPIDVRNPDGQRSPDSARLAVVPIGSLAAPLGIRAAAVVHPAPGSVYGQGEPVRPRGTLLTTGTGPVLVAWLFDGVPFERAVVQARGGLPVAVEARMPLPAAALGPHRVQLAVEGSQRLISEAVTVIQVVSRASRIRPLSPADGAVAIADDSLSFRWSPVAGATAYEIALRNRRGRTVATLAADRADRRLAPWEIAALTEGAYEWNVRPRFAGGAWGEPSDRHRLILLPASVELALEAPRRDPASGRIETRWTGGAAGLLYRVEFLDPAGARLFSALTTEPTYALPRGHDLPSGRLRVTALGPGGRVLGASSVLDVSASGSARFDPGRALDEPRSRAVALSHPVLSLASSQSGSAALAPKVVRQQPEPGQQVDSSRPRIEARWEPAIQPANVTLLVGTTDVTPVASVSPGGVIYTPLLALSPGEHMVSLALGESLVSWTFTVSGAGAPDDTDADLEGDPASPFEDDLPPRAAGSWLLSAEGTLTHNSGDDVASGVGGHAMVSVNADSGEPGSRGAFGRAVGDLSVTREAGSGNGAQIDNRNWVVEGGALRGESRQQLGVGYAPPSFLSGAELITAGLTTGGAEATLGARQAKLSYYQTFDGELAGVSAGTFGPEQRLRAAALELGGEERSYMLRVIGLRVEEDDGDFFFGGKGELVGVMGRWQLAGHSQVMLEIARGSMSPSAGSLEEASRGSAGRVAWSGRFNRLGIDASLRYTQADFVNPANRGMTAGGVPDRTGGEISVTQSWERSTLQALYQRTQTASGIGAGDGSLDALELRWSGGVSERVTLSLGGSTTSTRSGADEDLQIPEVEQRDWSTQVGLQEAFGLVTLGQDLSFQQSEDDNDPERYVEMAQAALSATIARGDRFQLSSQLSWVRSRAGSARNQSDAWLAMLQPALRLPKGLELQPYLSYSLTRDDLSPEDVRAENYRITLSWIPAWSRSLLAFQGSGDWLRHRGSAVADSPFVARYTASLTLRWGHPSVSDAAPGIAPVGFPPTDPTPSSPRVPGAASQVLAHVTTRGMPSGSPWSGNVQ